MHRTNVRRVSRVSEVTTRDFFTIPDAKEDDVKNTPRDPKPSDSSDIERTVGA
jgi:hypothetical protein